MALTAPRSRLDTLVASDTCGNWFVLGSAIIAAHRDTWAICPFSEHLPAPEARVSCGPRTRRVTSSLTYEERPSSRKSVRGGSVARRAAISSAGAAVNRLNLAGPDWACLPKQHFQNQGIATEAPAHATRGGLSRGEPQRVVSGKHAAVDQNVRPRHIRRLIRRKKRNGGCDVRWFPESAQRNRGEKLIEQTRVIFVEHRRIDDPRTNCIDSDSQRSELARR